jgi:hypothetical protein
MKEKYPEPTDVKVRFLNVETQQSTYINLPPYTYHDYPNLEALEIWSDTIPETLKELGQIYQLFSEIEHAPINGHYFKCVGWVTYTVDMMVDWATQNRLRFEALNNFDEFRLAKARRGSKTSSK